MRPQTIYDWPTDHQLGNTVLESPRRSVQKHELSLYLSRSKIGFYKRQMACCILCFHKLIINFHSFFFVFCLFYYYTFKIRRSSVPPRTSHVVFIQHKKFITGTSFWTLFVNESCVNFKCIFLYSHCYTKGLSKYVIQL